MKVLTKSSKQTSALGKKLARNLKKGDIIALFGNLGSGKTTFVKGVADGLGINRRSVNSPSFVLVKEYKANTCLYHFDLYRIRDLIEVFNIGYEEYLSKGGIIAIEWADRIKEALPKDYLEINFRFKNENERLLKFIGHGSHYKNLLKKI